MEPKIVTALEIRDRISRVSNEKYRNALKYAFLIGAETAEVCGEFAPKENNLIEHTFTLNSKKITTIIFIVNNIKPKERSKNRICAIPLDEKFEPWSKDLLDYFKKFEGYPFKFSMRAIQGKASEVFSGLQWQRFDHWQHQRNISEKYSKFRISDLRRLRIKNLKEYYRFNERDLALFCSWNDYPRDPITRNQVDFILSQDVNVKNIEDVVSYAKIYLPKLLRNIGQLGQETTPFYLDTRNEDVINNRYKRTNDICNKIYDLNESSRAKLNTLFFNENMPLVIEILNSCDSKDQYTTKIALLASLFKTGLKPWKTLLKKHGLEENRLTDLKNAGSIKHIETWLKISNIKHSSDIIKTWDYITELRNMHPIHYTDGNKLMDIYDYLKLPLEHPRDYPLLWETILNKFNDSLDELLLVMNAI